jgi:dethiobiotin synthetase
MIAFPKILFVTGTDTNVGKTFISALLVQGLKGIYWKPIQTSEIFDRHWVASHTNLSEENFLLEKYVLKQPLCPYLAAKEENKQIAIEEFSLPEIAPHQHLIIEGCGGLLVPINERHTFLDLLLLWQIPVLVVARNQLGTINHTLLTLRELQKNALPIFGVILNGKKEFSHKEVIETFGQVPVLAEIEEQGQISSATLDRIFHRSFG